MFGHPTSGPGDGIFPMNRVVRATNRSGGTTAKGEIVMFDLAHTESTEVDNSIPGSSDDLGNNSGYNNYVDPSITAPFNKHYIYGITLEAIADDVDGPVLIQGRVLAQVATATVAGTALIPNADGEMDVAAGTADCKVVAISEEVDDANEAMVLFDGVYGFGWDVTST
jgi:hypothetical protein